MMASARIMIVEDESIVAMGIKSKLEDLGYTVVGINARGRDAVETAFKTKPDLILMDIVLKGDMDGIEAAEAIRAHLDVPIIYLTAYSDDEVLKRAQITEPYGFILKPFKKSEVNANIQMAIYKHESDKKKSESIKKKILADFYDFILTAMPTSSTSSESEMRELLLKIFEERLDEDLYPQFAEYFQSMEFEDDNALFEAYIRWISDIIREFGIKTGISQADNTFYLEFFNCPWAEAKKKPMFCLNCNAMMNQSYNWTGLDGDMVSVSTIADGASRCMFQFK